MACDLEGEPKRLPFLHLQNERVVLMTEEDVIEVRRGRWERDELFAPYCTDCGESPMSAVRPEGNYRYCPNCGAEMSGGDTHK